MFFVLSDSSLVGIYLGVVREDCETVKFGRFKDSFSTLRMFAISKSFAINLPIRFY